MSYSTSRMLWFHKKGALSSAMFTLPVLGYITGYQAAVISAGFLLFFMVMNLTGSIGHGAIPLAAAFVFAMVRPPVISYEGRLYHVIRFYLAGGYSGRAPRRSSSVLCAAGEGHPPAAPQGRQGALPVTVHPGDPAEVSMILRDRNGAPAASRKVRILLEGETVKTDVSSSAGRITVLLLPEDCTGKKSISVCAIKDDGTTGDVLLWRELEFRA
ncbi:hypothetical protein CENSYa_0687 [Cenarchaeum symbiosum A]|uniref:Uncharacterized protein n=1 Tax=Cenarchaeum symbiosum (strain A) TaxID=414004 RepID=A0RVF3_CENSY|nr:hypothetical protein CENSYa_0687 [Cenarchaeum symbiosum A]